MYFFFFNLFIEFYISPIRPVLFLIFYIFNSSKFLPKLIDIIKEAFPIPVILPNTEQIAVFL